MSDGAVVVDTNVFSAVLSRPDLAKEYAKHLSGKRLIISFQTVAEIRFGALAAGWGTARTAQMERAIARAAQIPPHNELAAAWADLRHELQKAGHGLAAKPHMADLWIAATARVLDVPLVTHDRIFLDAPGLTTITELNRNVGE